MPEPETFARLERLRWGWSTPLLRWVVVSGMVDWAGREMTVGVHLFRTRRRALAHYNVALAKEADR